MSGLQSIVKLAQPLVGIEYLELGCRYLVLNATLSRDYLRIHRFDELAQMLGRKHVFPELCHNRLFQLLLVHETVRAGFLAALQVILAHIVMELAGLCRYAYHLGSAVLAVCHAAQKVFAGAFPWVHGLRCPLAHKRSYAFESFLADNSRMSILDTDNRFFRVGDKFAVIMVVPVKYIVADIRFVSEHIIDDRQAPLVASAGSRAFAVKRSGYLFQTHAAQGHLIHALYDNRFGWLYGKPVLGIPVDRDFLYAVSVRRGSTIAVPARGVFL